MNNGLKCDCTNSSPVDRTNEKALKHKRFRAFLMLKSGVLPFNLPFTDFLKGKTLIKHDVFPQ